MINYHEYGVNVKVYDNIYVEGQEILSDDDLNSAYHFAVETFWMNLSDHTKEHYNKECYSEGRMGGWAIFDTGEYEPPKEWVEVVNNYVTWIKDEVYPSIVKDMIEDKRYETHFVAVFDNNNSFVFVDSELKFVNVTTDKLNKLDYTFQIDDKITAGETNFVLDGVDVKQLANIKSR